MKGTRPLDNDEIRRVSTCFTGIFEVRNRGLFMIGVSTGGRISELLSLQIGDVWQNRQNVHEMLKKAFIAAGLNGKLATHSLRKSFAQRVYEHSGDIYLVQELPCHKSVATTQKYIFIFF